MFDVTKTTQALSIITATLIIIPSMAPSMAMAQQSTRVAKPVALDQVDTAELITALQQRDIVVPGHPTPAWTEIRNFTVRMEYRKYTGNPFALKFDNGDVNAQPTKTVFHSGETACDLSEPCKIVIPFPPGVTEYLKSQGMGYVTFVNRKSLREELQSRTKSPIGLDSLRGDAIGVMFSKAHQISKTVTGDHLGLTPSQRAINVNNLNPRLMLKKATPSQRGRTEHWVASYSSFREHGLVLDRPYSKGGRVTLTIIDGDPAPGVFQYALGGHAAPAIADELADRGIKVDVNNTQAPPNGHRTTPSRFIGLLTLQSQTTQIKTGQVLRSDPFILDRPFGCDLTNQACNIQFSPAGIGAQYYFALYPPSAAQINNPSNSVSGHLGFDRHPVYKQYESWAAFDKSHGLNAASENTDHQKGELYRVSDLMERGFANKENYPDGDQYKDSTWQFGFKIINVIQ